MQFDTKKEKSFNMISYMKKMKPKTKNKQIQLLTQADENKMKNIIREQPNLLKQMNENIAIRNDWIKAQNVKNYQNELQRLMNIEHKTIQNLRFPPSRTDDFSNSTTRQEQLINKINDNIVDNPNYKKYPHLINRYY
jgi:hypothetical protein